MKLLIAITATALFLGMYWMNASYNEAMTQCQVKHSFDTCFYSLNR